MSDNIKYKDHIKIDCSRGVYVTKNRSDLSLSFQEARRSDGVLPDLKTWILLDENEFEEAVEIVDKRAEIKNN